MDKPWTIEIMRPDEFDGLVRLHRVCFGDRSELVPFIRHRYVEARYPRTDIVVARDSGGGIIGTQAVTLFDGFMSGLPASIVMLSMGMVHPDYRGKGLFRALVESAGSRGFELGGVAQFTMPNEQSYPAFRKFASWHPLADRRAYVLPLDAARLAGDIAGSRWLGPIARGGGWLADVFFRGSTTLRCAGVFEADLEEVADKVDALAAAAGKATIGLTCRRDSRFLRWRFADCTAWRYRIFYHRGMAGRIDAYIVTKIEPRFRSNVGFIVDILADADVDTQVKLLGHVAGELRDQGATMLMGIWQTPGHCRLVERAGHVSVGGLLRRKFHTCVSLSPARKDIPSEARDASGWYLTLADFDTI